MTHLSILGQRAHRFASGLLPAANPGQFFDHNGVVVDGQGNLYVADSGNNRVKRRVVIEVANPPAAGTSDAGGD